MTRACVPNQRVQVLVSTRNQHAWPEQCSWMHSNADEQQCRSHSLYIRECSMQPASAYVQCSAEKSLSISPHVMTGAHNDHTFVAFSCTSSVPRLALQL